MYSLDLDCWTESGTNKDRAAVTRVRESVRVCVCFLHLFFWKEWSK
jgi:hypothetical protein